jgi:hypothetical protein
MRIVHQTAALLLIAAIGGCEPSPSDHGAVGSPLVDPDERSRAGAHPSERPATLEELEEITSTAGPPLAHPQGSDEDRLAAIRLAYISDVARFGGPLLVQVLSVEHQRFDGPRELDSHFIVEGLALEPTESGGERRTILLRVPDVTCQFDLAAMSAGDLIAVHVGPSAGDTGRTTNVLPSLAGGTVAPVLSARSLPGLRYEILYPWGSEALTSIRDAIEQTILEHD